MKPSLDQSYWERGLHFPEAPWEWGSFTLEVILDPPQHPDFLRLYLLLIQRL